MNIWHEFHGPNAGYILELYEKYQQDPNSVDAATREQFEQWQPPLEFRQNGHGAPTESASASAAPAYQPEKIMGAVNLAQSIRKFGHMASQIDPLGLFNPPGDPDLDLETHHITEADLAELPASLIGGPAAENAANAKEAIDNLRQIYSASIGFDYAHVRVPAERQWLQEMVETRRFRPPHTPLNTQALLSRLTEVETFELFLHRIFPGKTRFSIEGLDMMVPMLDEIIGGAAEADVFNVLIGMAHRGRLNVLAHILRRPYEEILTQFKDPAQQSRYEGRNYRGWTGDVKYHAGANRTVDFEGDDVVDLVIKMAPNPSHLEHVNPVVVGMARAAGTLVNEPGQPQFNHKITLPILIHGDAAFSGQGIVAETLNMHRLRGYRVGGTIHIIANNQVGFTTNYWSSRSTRYASDLAKGFKIPIVHVNADDPEACIEVARLAIAYRQKFQEDFLIDLVGYRRYGHNEGDEPRFTQPRMYQAVDALPTVRELWANTLVKRGDIAEDEPSKLIDAKMSDLQQTYESLKLEEIADTLEPQAELPPKGAAKQAATAVSANMLQELNNALLDIPADFNVNSKLARAMKKRRNALDTATERSIDWATAEDLALASILADGTAIRLTGEDVERGTFSHRHALLRDGENGGIYIPLQNIPQAQAAFEIRNSPLSENAAIGFEYGYNIEAPERLVIWEAQYGDFINTAQAIIDEYVVSGYAKWEQTPSLVLLLPHGYEGQGPDHSSGRLERFLQLAAKTNMRIAYPTTAAQYFHLLRRQAALLQTDPLPLIVMTPKSLLRHALSASTPQELATQSWQEVLDDPNTTEENAADVRRLVLCSGKVYVDLAEVQANQSEFAVAVARVEQLYSFPGAEIEAVLTRYPNLEEVVWLQEEPANMGAWEFMRWRLDEVINGRWPLRYIGRPRRASPAEGSSAWHRRNQKAITEHAFKFEEE
ncbi:MAG: 2-oxoglutarate dehydrogenase E1 component [Ardenticatenaceae bacterium]|nr:2-oxoglutarate dehydrogenase E1 component [Ardenticatenaceae bacterium]MCB8948800.1 2-oxoglutarate dehydrogenase E1 component [Ardenticatenaceae bacterium]